MENPTHYTSFTPLIDSNHNVVYSQPPVPTLYEYFSNEIEDVITMRRDAISPIDLLDRVSHVIGIASPRYKIIPNEKEYIYELVFGGKLPFRSTVNRENVHAVKHELARTALDYILRCPSMFHVKTVPLTFTVRSDGSYILTLRDMCRKYGFDDPIYEFDVLTSGGGWCCRVSITDNCGKIHSLDSNAMFSSQRRAKSCTAKAMFEKLTGKF